METVARGMPGLPLFIWPRFQEPESFAFLGLGDVALPGLVMCLLKNFDRFRQVFGVDNNNENIAGVRRRSIFSLKWSEETVLHIGYFEISCFCYSIGFIITVLAASTMKSAQPALLYLVPSLMIPIILLAWKLGDLHHLWQYGPSLPTTTTSSSSSSSSSPISSAAADEIDLEAHPLVSDAPSEENISHHNSTTPTTSAIIV
eukprot:TRINITY_DN2510_c0_g1_i3.p1 TRINITY_DN2510_c0_g1~~TRINITY_DN2510_c0_g1_i3.p1  ORF type:complete len:202 (+),score=66.97 TRINITY_DN2510_c0_g1_i3:546-1151(+)